MTLIDDHAQAFLALVGTDVGPPALVVLDGKVPDGTLPPYVLVYFAQVTPDAETAPDSTDLTFNSDRVELTAWCHSVGTTQAAARMVASRLRAAVLNRTPGVSGRSCWPTRQVDGQPVQPDETTGPAVFDLVDIYRFASLPA